MTDETAVRLLGAAEELFARKGFAGTSVRDITGAAGCNLASVNYHFGSKADLYRAVFERLLNQLRELRLDAVRRVVEEAAEAHDVEILLRAFADAFLQPLMDPARGPALLQLMMREMTEPRLPEGLVFERMIGPIQQAMHAALGRICPELDPMAINLCLHSFVGQLIHLVQVWRIMRGREATAAPVFDTARALDHVVRFSCAGIAALQAKSES